MYLSDLRVYFKVEVYFRVTWSRMEEYKIAEKISGLCQHFHVEYIVWPEGFIPWMINLQLFANIQVDQVQVTARGVCRLVLWQHYDMIILLA